MFKIGQKVKLIKHYSDGWPMGYIFRITDISNSAGSLLFPNTKFFLHGITANKTQGNIMDDYCEPYQEVIIKEEKDYYTWLANRT